MREIFVTYQKEEWLSGKKDARVEFKLNSATLTMPTNSIYGRSFEVFQVPEIKSSQIYVVVVTYDTGGTFSKTYDEVGLEGIYFSASEAEDIKSAILEKKYKEKYNKYEFWEGYFERLKNVDVCTLFISEILEEENRIKFQKEKDLQTLLDYVFKLKNITHPSEIGKILKKYYEFVS